MTSGRLKTPIEKQAILAKGDNVTPGGRRISPPGTVVVVPGRPGRVAFDHRTLPKMPASLSKRGKKEWFAIWDNGPWLHPDEDYRWVEMICQAYDEIEKFDEQIAKDGMVVQGYKNDMMVAHPLIKEKRECQRVIIKCLSILGFSPTDRARLGLAELKRQTGLADLQNRTTGHK